MTAVPPLFAGAVNVTTAVPLPVVAVPIVGAPGTVAGTNAFDAAEAGPVPTAFVAFTVQVYVLPFVIPVTEIGLAAADALRVTPPFDDGHVAV